MLDRLQNVGCFLVGVIGVKILDVVDLRRPLLDRVLMLALIVALWQAGSMWFGAYWLSSPWATTTASLPAPSAA